MASQESEDQVPRVCEVESMNSVQMADRATVYVGEMYETEYRGWGDGQNALSRLSELTGVPFWSLDHIKRGKAKTVETSLFNKIKSGYLRYCLGKVDQLMEKIEAEKEAHPNVSLDVLEEEVDLLSRKIEASLAAAK